MQTLAAGNKPACLCWPACRFNQSAGFTLLELLVVIAIMAVATAGVSLAMRDSSQVQLEREGERLAALFEAARARSRVSGVPVRWHARQGGFRFEGLTPPALPDQWLEPTTSVVGEVELQLGPEPIIGPQEVVLMSQNKPDLRLRLATDGLRPFSVQSFNP
ncbi:MAG: prepilin-type N-terminal cleavage/methylation domain-containing protein [Rhodoferax sp.]|jgi:general secretion pathway protein H|nr:prepilin-type N-terminal cleavage/methylation domain-containing protein [Rhodoferax sp.]MBP9058943.1 prepilin-type N-terminal cleavage/methylation domain-containing protein [Rhodoferax sp.]MBP9683543.1 prepilin-type N-terminal cleavage/methylation domain-containing protein [Rhodoferax sp.]